MWGMRGHLTWPVGLVLCTAIGCAGNEETAADAGVPEDDASVVDAGSTVVDAGIIVHEPLEDGVATLAGAQFAGNSDGPRDEALFDNPVNVIAVPGGDILVADFGNSSIRRVTPEGTVTTISEAPELGAFFRPFGLVVRGDELFVHTDGNSLGQPGGALWRMPISGGAVELARDNIGDARGLARLPDDRIVVSDYEQHIVRIFNPQNGTLVDLAGTAGTSGYSDGTGSAALFDTPYDVVIDASGDILVADQGNHVIRKIALDGTVTTFAGTGTAGSDDGARLSASFNLPQALAIDAEGVLYITDIGNYLIRAIGTDEMVTTVAGDGTAGYLDAEVPTEAKLFGLEGASFDSGADILYFSDGNRGEGGPFHRVRRLTFDQ